MADVVVSPGSQTSEGKLAKVVVFVSAAIGVLGTVASFLDAVSPLFMNIPAVAKYAAMAGVLVAAFTQAAYGLQRTLIKIAAINAGQPVPADPVQVKVEDAAAEVGK